MSRGPGIREIFSHKSAGKKDAFKLENQESKQEMKFSNKNDANAESPMKKFGAYKPKILAGEEDFIAVQTNTSTDVISTPPPPGNQEALSPKPQPFISKPWIIGDKNIPMVLGSINDYHDDDNNNNEPQIADSTTYNNAIHKGDYNHSDVTDSQNAFSISSESSTLVRRNSDDSRQGVDNTVLYDNSFIYSDDLGSISALPEVDTDTRSFKTNGAISDDQVEDELAGVYIPAPDYDEEEKTLEFNSEDTDDPSDGGEDSKPRQIKPKTTVKIYEGADLSHFLSEDDIDQKVVMRNQTKTRNTKSEVRKPKENQKQFMYKQQSSSKSKRKSSGNAPTFNSVRSFSYADSKFGTKSKVMGKSLSVSNLTDDDEIFLSTNTQQSSYESFLTSRHADDLPVEVRNGGAKNGELGQSSRKDDPVWKKLTLRLKQRMSRSMTTKEQ